MDLKPKDVIYFDKLQRDYENTINYYNDLVEHMESWKNSFDNNEYFMTKTGLNNDIKDIKAREKNKVTEQFILHICNYFYKNYSISTLTNNVINKIIENYVKYNFVDYKCKNDNLHYLEVIKYICKELKITDFDNRKIDDLRKRINEKFYCYWENKRIIIKNNKIKIIDYGFIPYADIWGKKVCLHDDTIKDFKDVALAYNYITTRKPELSKKFLQWLNNMGDWQKKIPNDEFYKLHNVNFNGIKGFRFYKNRSLEIKFNNENNKKIFIRVLKGEF